MADFLTPDRFELFLDAGAPVIRLHDVHVDVVQGWSLLNGLTMIVVDGPGEQGFLLARLGPAGDVAPAGWDDAVEARGGASVLVAGLPAFEAVWIDRDR